MYEIQNRSVWEHEQFSFTIEREDLKLLSEAKDSYLKELQTANSIDRLSNLASLRGKVFRRKVLDPQRLKGLGALLGSFGIYSYLPYISATTGPLAPVVVGCCAAFYGML